jgi:hypothetical protein
MTACTPLASSGTGAWLYALRHLPVEEVLEAIR